jgi:hypothetical protein
MAPSLRALGQKASACGLREERRGDGRGGGGGWDGVGGTGPRAQTNLGDGDLPSVVPFVGSRSGQDTRHCSVVTGRVVLTWSLYVNRRALAVAAARGRLPAGERNAGRCSLHTPHPRSRRP